MQARRWLHDPEGDTMGVGGDLTATFERKPVSVESLGQNRGIPRFSWYFNSLHLILLVIVMERVSLRDIGSKPPWWRIYFSVRMGLTVRNLQTDKKCEESLWWYSQGLWLMIYEVEVSEQADRDLRGGWIYCFWITIPGKRKKAAWSSGRTDIESGYDW